jgi:hypothetical protein
MRFLCGGGNMTVIETLDEPEKRKGLLDGYTALRFESDKCEESLSDDIEGLLVAHWLAESIVSTFESACGARVCGSLGTFDGVISESMPIYWKKTGDVVASLPLWRPDAHHPIGKWYADMAKRLLPCPPPEILDAMLRKHNIQGSREPWPLIRRMEDGTVVIAVHRLRKASLPKGVVKDDSLLRLWSKHQY